VGDAIPVTFERTDAGVVSLARASTHDRGGHVVAALSLPLTPC